MLFCQAEFEIWFKAPRAKRRRHQAEIRGNVQKFTNIFGTELALSLGLNFIGLGQMFHMPACRA